MSDLHYAYLPSRAVLRLSGADVRPFLQGLISNDVEKVSPDRAIYAAFLTPQGKFLHDMFIAADGDDLLLDCEAGRRDDLIKRLKLYRLRSKVEISSAEECRVVAIFGDSALPALGLTADAGAATQSGGTVAFVDPRLAAAGARAFVPAGSDASGFGDEVSADVYDTHRLRLGLPDGSRDMVVDKAILLESGFEELNGVDFQKGCYMGQELTARTKYRGLVKKRLLPVVIEGEAQSGAEITANGKNAGELRSVHEGRGIALIRLEALDSGAPMTAGEARISAETPDWLSR
jgi:folate-binding protein YgfZ